MQLSSMGSLPLEEKGSVVKVFGLLLPLAAILLASRSAAEEDEPCPLPWAPYPGGQPSLENLKETDDVTLAIGSGSGAVGDLVGVTVTLQSRFPKPDSISMTLE